MLPARYSAFIDVGPASELVRRVFACVITLSIVTFSMNYFLPKYTAIDKWWMFKQEKMPQCMPVLILICFISETCPAGIRKN